MPGMVETLLMNLRAEKAREEKARLPRARPPIPKGLELKYAVQLKNYQRAINKKTLELVEPLKLSTSSTGQITSTMDTLGDTVTKAILAGSILTGIVTTQGTSITTWNNRKYDKPLYNIIGLNNLGADRVEDMVTSWTTENIRLIKGVNDDQVKNLETLLLRNTRDPLGAGELTKQIRKIIKSSLNRSTLIARDQTLKLNGQYDRAKQTQAGVDSFIWRTSRDERVRPEHRAREGKVYSWKTGANGEFPGQPIKCRCTAEPNLEPLLGPKYKPAPPRPIKPPRPRKRRKAA